MCAKTPPIRVTGPPRSYPGRVIPDYSRAPDRLWTRLYVGTVNDDDNLETLQGFRPGGYYPIHLHDQIHDGQYRIIHKLGHGGFATVWLCQDQHADILSYVAIKILIASETERDSCVDLLLADKLMREREGVADTVDKVPVGQLLCLPLKHFMVQSPSGTHICLVYPVLGPVVRDAADIFGEEVNAIEILQEISRQTVMALAVLHSHGICHGDFRPSNILLELQTLDGLDEEEVLSLLGEPQRTDIGIRKDSHLTPEIPYAPKYLVYPPDSEDFEPSAVLPRARVIDFGQSFDTSQQPPPAAFGIPVNYSAPEVVIDKSGSKAMDLWSLGCTLYEIRFGRRLFNVIQLIGLRKEDYMDEVAPLLGDPPEPWMKYYLESDDESDTSGSLSDESTGDDEDTYIEPQVERVHSIQKKLARCHDCTGEGCRHPRFQLISEAEAATFADLLERLLRYQPEERLSAQDVLKHAWFHTKY